MTTREIDTLFALLDVNLRYLEDLHEQKETLELNDGENEFFEQLNNEASGFRIKLIKYLGEQLSDLAPEIPLGAAHFLVGECRYEAKTIMYRLSKNK